MIDVQISDTWKIKYPDAHIGLLLTSNIDNRVKPTVLEGHKRSLEASLREGYRGFTRADLVEIETMTAYRAYYKSFRKTYHVQLQLESILFSGKNLPSVNLLVDVAFMAEMETLILTATHDVDLLVPPVIIDSANGIETFTLLNGESTILKADDMMMKDAQGVVCTVIYGQDKRTAVSKLTHQALYVCYVPAGIELSKVETHLDKIQNYIDLFSPQSEILYRKIIP